MTELLIRLIAERDAWRQAEAVLMGVSWNTHEECYQIREIIREYDRRIELLEHASNVYKL